MLNFKLSPTNQVSSTTHARQRLLSGSHTQIMVNHFLIDLDTNLSAKHTCDQHVNRMILETCQLLYTAWHVNANELPAVKESEPQPYKKTHTNHPTAIWTRAHENNYNHMVAYAFALNKEAIARYPDRKVEHKCMQHLRRLQSWGYPKKEKQEPIVKKRKRKETIYASVDLPEGLTKIPLCMPQEFIVKKGDCYSALKSYRKYYRSKELTMKRGMTWKRNKPTWF